MTAPSGWILQIRSLSVAYPESALLALGPRREVVLDLNFECPSGSVVGIWGTNGSGKSSVLRALVDPRRRSSGAVLVDGRELRPDEVAYVPQNAGETLSPWLTIADEVALRHRIRIRRDADEDQEKISQLVGDLAIPQDRGRRTWELSGGQKVRVAIARALNSSSIRLAVLDEPFEGLDQSSRQSLIAKIHDIAAQGAVVFVTSHRRTDLEEICTTILRFHGHPVRAFVEDRGSADLQTSSVTPSSITSSHNFFAGRFSDVALSTLGIVLGLVVWELCARAIHHPGLLPHPVSVLRECWRLIISPDLRPHLFASLARSVGAWVISCLAAVPIGLTAGYSKSVYRLLAPWLSVLRAAPMFVLVSPVVAVFAGHGEAQRVALISLPIVLFVTQSIAATAAFAPRTRMDIARIFGAKTPYLIFRILLPEAAGGVAGALEATFPLAFVLTLVVEGFLIPHVGIGSYLYQHLYDTDLSMVLAHILMIGAIAAIGVAGVRRVGTRWSKNS